MVWIDWHAPAPHDDGLSTVEVFDVDNPLTNKQLSALRQSVNALSESSQYGIDLFLLAIQIVTQIPDS